MTKPKYKHIYQFKITLEDSKPVIWRRIQVPENYTFWDLHVAIQDAMGWYDCHLHQFEMVDPKQSEQVTIGKPDEEFDEPILTEWKTSIADYFSLKNKKAFYTYDFGDDWRHKIVLEKIAPIEVEQTYPQCVAGEMACPPEDCGGIYGYQDLIEIMNDPKHEDHESMLEWLGRELEPTAFSIDSIHFSNPKQRFKEVF
jgi:hypothetical protein